VTGDRGLVTGNKKCGRCGDVETRRGRRSLCGNTSAPTPRLQGEAAARSPKQFGENGGGVACLSVGVETSPYSTSYIATSAVRRQIMSVRSVGRQGRQGRIKTSFKKPSAHLRKSLRVYCPQHSCLQN
jgi:hypothetical protein